MKTFFLVLFFKGNLLLRDVYVHVCMCVTTQSMIGNLLSDKKPDFKV